MYVGKWRNIAKTNDMLDFIYTNSSTYKEKKHMTHKHTFQLPMICHGEREMTVISVSVYGLQRQ